MHNLHLILENFSSAYEVITRRRLDMLSTLENDSRIKYRNVVHSSENISLNMSNLGGSSRNFSFDKCICTL